LEQATDELASFLAEHPEISLADAAHTLRVGRHAFPHRRMLVCASAEDAAAALAARAPERVLSQRQERVRRPVAFLFPGQGAQHPGMARDLYAAEPVFRREVDAAAEQLLPRLGRDLRELLLDEPGERAASELRETRLAQPALFVVEHALARLWLSWGVKPWAMMGHSVGEYVAACLAGVFSPADALDLVAARGELMQSLPPGAMLAVDLPESEVAARLANHPELSLAAVNGPSLCVVSGPEGAIEVFAGRRLHTSHAFHSAMMEPILERFRERVAKTERKAPAIPYLSNLTGGWIAPGEAMDPDYWVRHLRHTVRFGDGMDRLLAGAAENGAVLLEVGPGRTLAELARQAGRGAGRPGATILSSLRHPKDPQPDAAALLQAAGRLWLSGVAIDWEAFCGEERRRRVPLPGYPFQRRRFWIEAARSVRPAQPASAPAAAPPEPIPAAHARPELAATPFAAPRDETERRLAGIWQELLGIAAPGIHDDFFELGGHSLLATRLISRVRQAFGVELPLEAVFEAPTVARLAARITTASLIAEPPIVPVPREGELPLSYAQQRLLFLDVLAHGDTAYNLPLGLRLAGPLDPRALAGALAGLVARHEVLRTTFRIASGRAWQVVSPEAPAPDLPLVDLSGLPADAAEAQARRLAAEDASRRFDLFAGPVLRAALFKLAPAEHALVITVHHVAGDGWSWGVLLREIVELYESALEGRAPRLPALPVQYADFAAWQRCWLAGEVLDRQIDYWRRRLAGLPVVELPPDRPRPAVRSGRGNVEPVAIPHELAAALGRLGRQEEATLFMVLVSAFCVLLHYYEGSGADDVVLGTDVANRNRGETEGILGLFVNQLVLRNDLSGDPTFRELLGRVRRTTLEAYAHQDAPFDKLVEVLNPARDMSRTPLFQVKMVLQNTPLEARAVRGLSVSLFEFHNQTAKFDLLLNLTEGPAGLAGNLEYSTDLYEPATIRRLLANFAALLAAVAERPDGRLSEIEAVLRESDREAWQRRSQERREQRRGAVERVRRKAIAVH
jgi:malonyl CoA-acyl carrier protein transacylase/acyl carrier protein